MRRLFLTPAHLSSETVVIDGPDFHHLVNVLRVRAGEPLVLLDGKGHAWHAVIEQVGKRLLTARRMDEAETAPYPAVHVAVAQALGKGDKFEQVIQHGTEAGASEFIPLVTQRTVVHVGPRDVESKLARWRLVAKGAAEQACRPNIPKVYAPVPMAEFPRQFLITGENLLLHPDGQPLSSFPANFFTCSFLVMVGPEGGFTDEEVELAVKNRASIVSLGPYVLRTETAALVAVSQILFAAVLHGHKP